MSTLTQRIRAAQVEAGELAVVRDLHERGLCMQPCEICETEKQPKMTPSLEQKIATMLVYCEEIRAGRRSRDNKAFDSYLDDPEVAEWITKMKNSGRVKFERFTGNK